MASDGGKTLVRYLRREVAAHSPYYRRLLGAPNDKRWPRSIDGLDRLPMATLAKVEDPAELVLRPDWTSLGAWGDMSFAARVAVSRFSGRRQRRSRRLIDHRYKPLHWILQDGVPVGSSAADLERLGGLGARWLSLAGVGPTDVVISLLPQAPNLAFWQLVLGAREAGVSALHLPLPLAPVDVAELRPTVLAGRPFDLARLLATGRAEGRPLAGVHTLLVLGETLEQAMRAKLTALLDAPGAGAVVAAWAPPGVRALWTECRPGAVLGASNQAGLHTWPGTEVLEIVDPLSGTAAPPGADGELVWTPLGWRGTVVLRLRTGVFASLEPGPCPACGGRGPRLCVASDTPAFLTVLDRDPAITAWQAELRTVGGHEELLVFLSLVPMPAPASGEPEEAVARVVAELDAQLSATQYVVLDAGALDARLAAHDDRRVVDLRRR